MPDELALNRTPWQANFAAREKMTDPLIGLALLRYGVDACRVIGGPLLDSHSHAGAVAIGDRGQLDWLFVDPANERSDHSVSRTCGVIQRRGTFPAWSLAEAAEGAASSRMPRLPFMEYVVRSMRASLHSCR